ncbi:NAD(P)/FAD-dependent oxidoreductase [Mongoliitalea daihaiensis]|uniref:NAD(P)/FAD-dependent oxidoreductase n=1 Tax=Mongoliitalea daihaiensis TaxID=2782006 RepID=UPI001F3A4390|nr:FAD/NAD(P)-binding oxidoreductase [Mongoliitalea daihaiensis]UJP64777.1 NAD(P)/FAD-dependent oxidoreductase [Mongoliitalea daihaiensis]
MNNSPYVIIGNGIAGITCARHIRKYNADAPILVISGESEHFFSRTALMYIYMGHMKYEHTKPYEDWFWEKNRIHLKRAWITDINLHQKTIHSSEGELIPFGTLIIATGSKPFTIGWPGEHLKGVQGLYSLQDLEQMEANTQGIQHAVIVGGGLIGIEMAEMLQSRHIDVTFLVREKNFWDNVLPEEEAKVINRHIKAHGVDLRLASELQEILSDEKGAVRAIRTAAGEEIPCQFVGLTIGVTPNIEFLKNQPTITTNKGVMVDQFFRTSVPDVYAIGDCAEFIEAPGSHRKNIEQVWYTGRMHGETLAYNLTHSDPMPYKPGIWFNSAKFFDLEYQTYGWVPNKIPAVLDTFYWENNEGTVAIRFTYDKTVGTIKGINTIGWRMRHAYFDRAIEEGWLFEKILSHLDRANFDAEFSKNYTPQVILAYNKAKNRSLSLPKKGLIRRLLTAFS